MYLLVSVLILHYAVEIQVLFANTFKNILTAMFKNKLRIKMHEF